MRLFSPRSLRAGIGASLVFSILGKGLGYGRQLLIAYYFGIARNLDIYFMANGIALLMVFSVSTLMEQVAVPHLVREKEEVGEEAHRRLCGTIVLMGGALGIAITLLFILLFPAVAWVMAKGFSAGDQIVLRQMAMYFVPWVLLSMPYACLGAVLKSLRHYDAVLIAEFLTSCGALAVFVFWHSDPRVLPLTLAAGYGIAILFLLAVSWKYFEFGGLLWNLRLRAMFRNFAELFTANQMASIGAVVDRFFQSHLIPGAISGLNYAVATLGPINDLVAFKEFYVVSLSSREQQEARLERLLKGILFLTVPLSIYLAFHAELIVHLLYERGRFGPAARVLTAHMFAIWAATLVSGSLGAPMFRMFQIMDRIRYSGIVYLLNAGILAVLAAVLVFHLKWDSVGVAVALVLSNYVNLVIEYVLLRRCGLRLNLLSFFRVLGFCLAAGCVAAFLSQLVPSFPATWLTLLVRSAVFLGAIAAFYFFVRRSLVHVLYGASPA